MDTKSLPVKYYKLPPEIAQQIMDALGQLPGHQAFIPMTNLTQLEAVSAAIQPDSPGLQDGEE